MRRRILLTTDSVGGVWTYSLDLARGLAKAEDAVIVLAVMGPSPSAAQVTEAAAVPGLLLIDTGLVLDWMAEREEDVGSASEALARLAAECGADLVQLHSPALALAAFPVPVVSVVHSCVATWWQAVHEGPLPGNHRWRTDLVGIGLRRSDRLVAPSCSFAAALRQAYGPGLAIKPVHNGRSVSGFAHVTPPADRAITSGRLWDAGKNVAAFDRAAGLSNLHFSAAGPLVGPGGERVRLEHAEALGPLDTSAIAALLAQRPIFVSTALYEPFGLGVLEAALAGCALVLADRPVFRELWDGSALFVDPLDAEAIAVAVDGLVQDPDGRAGLGDRARMRAAGYSPARMVAAMQRLYNALTPVRQRVAA